MTWTVLEKVASSLIDETKLSMAKSPRPESPVDERIPESAEKIRSYFGFGRDLRVARMAFQNGFGNRVFRQKAVRAKLPAAFA